MWNFALRDLDVVEDEIVYPFTTFSKCKLKDAEKLKKAQLYSVLSLIVSKKCSYQIFMILLKTFIDSKQLSHILIVLIFSEMFFQPFLHNPILLSLFFKILVKNFFNFLLWIFQ